MHSIKYAKDQIKLAVQSYIMKDEYGNPLIPIDKQRPVYLEGPPGIGKTAIMKQIAQELNVPIVSYSMTHHTRQSAQGMPKIVEKTFDGQPVLVTEYTLSEIIAKVMDVIEKTDSREGILFLDEINCVSETLRALMLQFLQNKIFGNHKLPEGWILVTAGNPPMYNDSVREFDIATLDRVRKISVEADFDVWKEYALNADVHPAIISYLETKKDKFYSLETTIDGKQFVTARGWEDLSQTIRAYEKLNVSVDLGVIGQYIQSKEIAKSFAMYYDLFNKYRSDYQVDKILEGNADAEIKSRARAAQFDERIALLGLLEDASVNAVRDSVLTNSMLFEIARRMNSGPKTALCLDYANPPVYMREYVMDIESELSNAKYANRISSQDEAVTKRVIEFIKDYIAEIEDESDGKKAFEKFQAKCAKTFEAYKKNADKIKIQIDNILAFIEEVYGDESQEMLIYMTEITANTFTTRFCQNKPSDRYKKNIKLLLLDDEDAALHADIDKLFDDAGSGIEDAC